MEKIYSVYFQKSIVLIFERILVISAFSNVFKFLHFQDDDNNLSTGWGCCVK